MIDVEEVKKLIESKPKRKYVFNRLGFELGLPSHLDVHVTDAGFQGDVNGYFASLIKPGKFHPAGLFYRTIANRKEAIKKLVEGWNQQNQNPSGAYWVFRDLNSKGAGIHIIYCYRHPSNDEQIPQNFIEGHEEMHAYVHLLSQEGLVRSHEKQREEALNALRGRYPKLAENIIPYFDGEKDQILAHCGGFITNTQQGVSLEVAFDRMQRVAKKNSGTYPSFGSELEEAISLLS